MALATLYAEAVAKDTSLPNCHAFIIDHKVRPESTEEADWVKEQLRWKCPYTQLLMSTIATLTTFTCSGHSRDHHPSHMAVRPKRQPFLFAIRERCPHAPLPSPRTGVQRAPD
jgi:hypothetical protein